MRKLLLFTILLLGCHQPEKKGWHSLGKGIAKSNDNYVAALAVFNDKLYVGGHFDSAGGQPVNNIAAWNGEEWEQTDIQGIKDEDITGMIVYKGQLYITALKLFKNNTVQQVERWNGAKWEIISGKVIPEISGVACFKTMAIYKNDLFIGGKFDGMDKIHSVNIIKWDGNKWDSLGKGLMGEVDALAEYKDSLYAGGTFQDSDYMMCGGLRKWDGEKWDSSGFGGVQWVFSLATYDNELYMGGDYITINPGDYPVKKPEVYRNISKWNGSNWSSAGRLNPDVLTMCVFNNILYAGGEFDTADGKPAVCVAKWDGNHWTSIGNERWFFKPVEVNKIIPYKGQLYMAGGFVMASGVPAFDIVRWIPPTN